MLKEVDQCWGNSSITKSIQSQFFSCVIILLIPCGVSIQQGCAGLGSQVWTMLWRPITCTQLVCGLLRGEVLRQRHVPGCVHPAAVCLADWRRGRPSESFLSILTALHPFSRQRVWISTKAQGRLVGGIAGHPVPS